MSNINFAADKLAEASLLGGALQVAKLDVNDEVIDKHRYLGYCSGIELSPSDDKAQLRSSSSTFNALAEEALLSREVSVTITLQDFQPENLELALAGSLTKNAAAAGVVEVHSGFLGNPTPLNGIIDFGGTATVITDTTGATTYEEGLNYELNQGSVYWLADQSGATEAFVDGQEFEITYDAKANSTIEGYNEANINVELYFEGYNTARNNSVVKIWLWKVSLDPSSSYSILTTDDFSTLEMTGTLLESKAVSGSGASKLFKQVNEDLNA